MKQLTQDFTRKFAIVISDALESWQAMNTATHIAAYLGNKMGEAFESGAGFITKDGVQYPRNSQYPIIILSADSEQLKDLMLKVGNSGLLCLGFIKEMIEYSDDEELSQALSEQIDKDVEVLGIGVFGKNEKVDALMKKYSLWK